MMCMDNQQRIANRQYITYELEVKNNLYLLYSHLKLKLTLSAPFIKKNGGVVLENEYDNGLLHKC